MKNRPTICQDRLRTDTRRAGTNRVWFPFLIVFSVALGNHYAAASLVKDSEEASMLLIAGGSGGNEEEGEEGEEGAMSVSVSAAEDVSRWGGFASALLNSSLPVWFGDSLLNSLHHTRSAMWLGDGRWRQVRAKHTTLFSCSHFCYESKSRRFTKTGLGRTHARKAQT
jgi:hypothetical protein